MSDRRARDQRYYASHRHTIIPAKAAYKRKNRVRINARRRELRAENLARCREYERNQALIRYHSGRTKRPKSKSPLTDEARLKARCRTQVRQALCDGVLVRPDKCDRCPTRCKPDAHHEDYSKPLEVEWLCDQCHGLTMRKPL